MGNDQRDDAYNEIVEIVAENPGAGADDISDFAVDRGIDSGLEELFDEAVDREDIVEADDKYWVMRKGEYAFEHPSE